jgi:protein involved in polysaccharide export with SLBB domain
MTRETKTCSHESSYQRFHLRRALLCGAFLFAATGCKSNSSVESELTQTTTQSVGSTQSFSQDAYKLGSNDKLRVIVFGEDNLSGEFVVNGSGNVDMPLIGGVKARGATVREFQERVVAKYKSGYLNDPKISVEVFNYRPFFITGVVKNGGEYPDKSGLSVQDAVAVAGGYTYRANTGKVFIRRAGANKEQEVDLEKRVSIVPGDNIRILERYF